MNASIKAIELKFGTNVTKNPFSATFGSLDGLAVADVEAGDYAFGKHRARSLRVMRPS